MFQVHVGTLGKQSSSSGDLEDIMAETQVTRPWKAGTCMEDLYTKPSPLPASAHSDFDWKFWKDILKCRGFSEANTIT